AKEPTQCFGFLDACGGTTSATGSPKRVTRTVFPVLRTLSNTARQVALNLEIAISSIPPPAIIILWSTTMVKMLPRETFSANYGIRDFPWRVTRLRCRRFQSWTSDNAAHSARAQVDVRPATCCRQRASALRGSFHLPTGQASCRPGETDRTQRRCDCAASQVVCRRLPTRCPR